MSKGRQMHVRPRPNRPKGARRLARADPHLAAKVGAAAAQTQWQRPMARAAPHAVAVTKATNPRRREQCDAARKRAKAEEPKPLAAAQRIVAQAPASLAKSEQPDATATKCSPCEQGHSEPPAAGARTSGAR